MKTSTFDYTQLNEYMLKNGFTVQGAGVYKRGETLFDLSALDTSTEEKIIGAIIKISFEAGLERGQARLQGKLQELLGL